MWRVVKFKVGLFDEFLFLNFFKMWSFKGWKSKKCGFSFDKRSLRNVGVHKRLGTMFKRKDLKPARGCLKHRFSKWRTHIKKKFQKLRDRFKTHFVGVSISSLIFISTSFFMNISRVVWLPTRETCSLFHGLWMSQAVTKSSQKMRSAVSMIFDI